MVKQYRLLVFDWEGTLADSLGPILNCIAKQAKNLHFGEINPQSACQWLGLGLAKAIKKIFPDLNLSQQEKLLLAVHQGLAPSFTETYLIPGAKEFIARIAQTNIKLAIATNKGHQSLQRALFASKLDRAFKVTRSAGLLPAKPCPQMLEEILAECAVSNCESLMLGDSVSDIEMAKSLNVDAIGIDFYNQQHNALEAAGAIYVFENYEQIANFLELPPPQRDPL